eukprot:CAMPEP_0171827132 /NCGR_PEP_ID=MMETSP0992-20121227/6467_1 /TAXON_ID=483369 /ORGANISM="non described non described, Strain CCMP2098" /LENGTH=116 /DNA_ID=CAMNT_0012442229 /DNA_START=343 /DNA_END=691 /DNA_ORIENTATION=-
MPKIPQEIVLKEVSPKEVRRKRADELLRVEEAEGLKNRGLDEDAELGVLLLHVEEALLVQHPRDRGTGSRRHAAEKLGGGQEEAQLPARAPRADALDSGACPTLQQRQRGGQRRRR